MALKKGLIPPKVGAARRFNVNRPGMVEAIWQPLYDFQSYPAAGTTKTFTYFAVPNGQSSKTFEDTNMEMAAALPSPKEMLVTHIEVVFLPGSPITAIDAAAPVLQDYWNDCQVMMKKGYLDFYIGSKSYLTDAPIGKFSNSFRLGGVAGMGTGSAGSHATNYASFCGPLYEITPVKIVANQNFNVTLNFPTTAAISPTQTSAARLGVILGGFLYRLSQ